MNIIEEDQKEGAGGKAQGTDGAIKPHKTFMLLKTCASKKINPKKETK